MFGVANTNTTFLILKISDFLLTLYRQGNFIWLTLVEKETILLPEG